MSLQKFYACPKNKRQHPNGAVSYGSPLPFGIVSNAKIHNCPIDGSEARATVYQTGHPDTMFSAPAATRIGGRYVGGFITGTDEGPEFRPYDRYRDRAPAGPNAALARRCFLRIGSDYLTDAKPYKSRAAAVRAYLDCANELRRYGQAIEASLHYASTAETLAEYPDFVLSLGPNGGLKMEAC